MLETLTLRSSRTPFQTPKRTDHESPIARPGLSIGAHLLRTFRRRRWRLRNHRRLHLMRLATVSARVRCVVVVPRHEMLLALHFVRQGNRRKLCLPTQGGRVGSRRSDADDGRRMIRWLGFRGRCIFHLGQMFVKARRARPSRGAGDRRAVEHGHSVCRSIHRRSAVHARRQCSNDSRLRHSRRARLLKPVKPAFV